LSNLSRAIIDPGSSGLLPTFVALYTVVVIRLEPVNRRANRQALVWPSWSPWPSA